MLPELGQGEEANAPAAGFVSRARGESRQRYEPCLVCSASVSEVLEDAYKRSNRLQPDQLCVSLAFDYRDTSAAAFASLNNDVDLQPIDSARDGHGACLSGLKKSGNLQDELIA
jgi:hypothetical protein